ncbi:MAG: hypothetical protein KDA37_02840 [Planctomycetales bacterium]|nr:hypothetical protein [Planctomycetales bacterium]
MSLGPLGGVLGSAAGAPLSQTKGSETERAAREGASQDNRVAADKKADEASGIGHTEEDQASDDRDADGRRLWEAPPEAENDEAEATETTSPTKQVKDPRGESGNQLDLTG